MRFLSAFLGGFSRKEKNQRGKDLKNLTLDNMNCQSWKSWLIGSNQP